MKIYFNAFRFNNSINKKVTKIIYFKNSAFFYIYFYFFILVFNNM